MNNTIASLKKRIERLRRTLREIANACDCDNPYAELVDRTESLMDDARLALLADDELMKEDDKVMNESNS